jgi:hypothetical protein
MNWIECLPPWYFVAADNAYICMEHLLTLFCGLAILCLSMMRTFFLITDEDQGRNGLWNVGHEVENSPHIVGSSVSTISIHFDYMWHLTQLVHHQTW